MTEVPGLSGHLIFFTCHRTAAKFWKTATVSSGGSMPLQPCREKAEGLLHIMILASAHHEFAKTNSWYHFKRLFIVSFWSKWLIEYCFTPNLYRMSSLLIYP